MNVKMRTKAIKRNFIVIMKGQAIASAVNNKIILFTSN